MYHKIVIVVSLVAMALTGCNFIPAASTATPVLTSAPTLEFVQPTSVPSILPTQPVVIITTTPLSLQQAILDLSSQVVAALKAKDMSSLAGFAHPQMGLRFSPYAAVKDTDLVFPADKVASLMADNTLYTWGAFFGSGEAINLSFSDYYAQFIYDEDFANAPEISLNHRLGSGTTLDNIFEFYQSSMVVEYHFPSFDPQFEGMDWRSLRLVFLQADGAWYLVGIVHDQWTT